MVIFELIKDGFRLTHKNWQVILVQIAFMIVSCIGFFIFVGLPLAIAFVYFGIDLVQVKDFLQMFRSPAEILSRYFGLVIFILTAFILYLGIVSALSIFTFGGTLGVLRNSVLDSQYKFSLSSFFQEGKKLFFPITGFAIVASAGLVVVFFIFGVFGGCGFSIISAYREKETFIAVFTGTFFALLLIACGLVIVLGALALVFYSVMALVVERIGPLKAFKKGFTFIKENPKAFIFYAVLIMGYMSANFLLMFLVYPLSLIPAIGPIIGFPFHLVSYILQSYLWIVIMSSLLIFYMWINAKKEAVAESA
ncbi:MAG: hypothetical protein HZC12_09260 [Nitrospirae bacterium]|nr:hypothetical protein [Nitrospirota bacterium]